MNKLNTPAIIECFTQCDWRGFKSGVTVDYNDIVHPMIGARFSDSTISNDTMKYQRPYKGSSVGKILMGGIPIAKTFHYDDDSVKITDFAKIIQ